MRLIQNAFVLLHKLRSDGGRIERPTLGGDGKGAEIDGGYFGGYVKPANFRDNRVDRRARIGQRNFLAVCVAPNKATITISLAHICFARGSNHW
jgi:hypothetical protein